MNDGRALANDKQKKTGSSRGGSCAQGPQPIKLSLRGNGHCPPMGRKRGVRACIYFGSASACGLFERASRREQTARTVSDHVARENKPLGWPVFFSFCATWPCRNKVGHVPKNIPKVDTSVARPGARFAAWSAAVCIAGTGAPGMRTGGRGKKGKS